ncbi:SLC44A1, partial [Symbiodinium necroappetens]
DGFAVQILANLWRLDGPVQPEWSMERFAKLGVLCFADTTQPFCKHALDLRLYQALQAVCIWTLALLLRAIGLRNGASNLWEFCNADALCATILVKGALSFQRARRVPHDLAQLQKAILSSALGLSHPSLVFDGEGEADVGIAERQEQLLSHCALLAAVASENELLDCLLSYDWAAATDLVPVLAAHLAVMASSTQLPLPHLEDAATNYLRHLKLRSLIIWDILLLETSPERGFLRDCAQLAFHVAPSPEAARSLVSRVNEADALAVAFSCALLANAGLGPKETAETAKLFHKLSAAMRGQARAQLEMTSFWRKDKADDWLSLFGLEPKEAKPKRPEPERSTVLAESRRRAPSTPGLRDLMSDVPKEFCCALDGRLLVDPVRTPGGRVYERSVLAKTLAEGDPRVLSDSPYTLQDCQRDAGLRARIVDWVRSTHSQSKEKRHSRCGVCCLAPMCSSTTRSMGASRQSRLKRLCFTLAWSGSLAQDGLADAVVEWIGVFVFRAGSDRLAATASAEEVEMLTKLTGLADIAYDILR